MAEDYRIEGGKTYGNYTVRYPGPANRIGTLRAGRTLEDEAREFDLNMTLESIFAGQTPDWATPEMIEQAKSMADRPLPPNAGEVGPGFAAVMGSGAIPGLGAATGGTGAGGAGGGGSEAGAGSQQTIQEAMQALISAALAEQSNMAALGNLPALFASLLQNGNSSGQGVSGNALAELLQGLGG